MNVVLAPTEIAGQMGLLCQGLRQYGVTANGYNWFQTYLGFKENIVNTDAYELAKVVDPIARFCDVFHFQNGNTLLTSERDLPYLYSIGKKMVMHHWGNDVRSKKMVQQLNPYPLPPSYYSDEKIHEKLTYLSKYIKHAIVQDYEMYPYVKDYYEHVHIVPLICDSSRFSPLYPDVNKKTLTIIHAPTNRDFKGSLYIEQAINELKPQYNFNFIVVEKMNHQQALQTYLSGDIIIDQVLCGTYGVLSVEAMAMGKTVIAYIRNDVKQHLPSDFPIVNANPDTLKDVLAHLLQNPFLCHQIGKNSRAFVEKYHSLDFVTQKTIAIYQGL